MLPGTTAIPPRWTRAWLNSHACFQVWAELAPGDADFLHAELDFFGAVTGVSGALYPVPKDQRRVAAAELVRKARPAQAYSSCLK